MSDSTGSSLQVVMEQPATAQKVTKAKCAARKSKANTLTFDYEQWEAATTFCQQIMYADEAQWHEKADVILPFLRKLFTATAKPTGEQETEGIQKYYLAPKTHLGVLELAMAKWRETTATPDPDEDERKPRRRATKALVLLIFGALRRAFDAIPLKKKGDLTKEEEVEWRVQLGRIRSEALEMTPAPPKPKPFRLMDGVGE